MFNFLKTLPVPAFAWPLIIAFFASLPILFLVETPSDREATYLLGMTSHTFWGIFFASTLVSMVLVGVVVGKIQAKK